MDGGTLGRTSHLNCAIDRDEILLKLYLNKRSQMAVFYFNIQFQFIIIIIIINQKDVYFFSNRLTSENPKIFLSAVCTFFFLQKFVNFQQINTHTCFV